MSSLGDFIRQDVTEEDKQKYIEALKQPERHATATKFVSETGGAAVAAVAGGAVAGIAGASTLGVTIAGVTIGATVAAPVALVAGAAAACGAIGFGAVKLFNKIIGDSAKQENKNQKKCAEFEKQLKN